MTVGECVGLVKSTLAKTRDLELCFRFTDTQIHNVCESYA